MTKPKSRITKITVARLYNLGRYEHVRYEISAEVERSGKPTQVFVDLLSTLCRLKPVSKPPMYDSAVAALDKAEDTLSAYDKEHLEEYREMVKDYAAALALRWEAVKNLDSLGGVSKHEDAKKTWDAVDDTPF
jgi:hypothetical protein